MFNKVKLLLVLFAASGSSIVSAQVDLKDLRAKPDTSIVNSKDSPMSKLNKLHVPIPKLDMTVDYWKHWTKFGLNANQASFSDNWSAGGVNSVALGGLAWHKSEYNKNNFQFVTELDLKYGKIKNKDQLAKKNNDRIFWDNKLAYKLSKTWALYVSLTFESQFDLGYTYDKDSDGKERIKEYWSSFMGPGYFTESFGLEYKPDNTFSLRLGTGTARQTLVLDSRVKPLTIAEYAEKYPENKPITKDQEKFGLKPGQSFRNDLAFQLTANLDRNLAKNLNLKARYNMFADYKELTDPDHRLDATLTAKITSLINVSLSGIMVYNSGEASKIQHSQALAMGLMYTLPR
ncbi:DUF3078 domain-containing protein [Sphingobacterium psychroaquaticum]|uniref:DUF3078 domain-containing protein n=1 Tax=Sphingobacterium psychroaquaticum TaxID=561061 RepID=A0A1X7KD53_9SPHI|nr:DUF3078 domain-containing protein [Sphingobacterium psychroaquaticum]SMG38831.1 Protein of unknown function [Sphingobacterium psychroaquaticum]